jgi:hypothetical protein
MCSQEENVSVSASQGKRGTCPVTMSFVPSLPQIVARPQPEGK